MENESQESGPYLRRTLRLETYLEPYPEFSFHLADSLEEPFRVTAVTRRGNTRYIVEVFAPLLEEKGPLWLEESILRYLQRYASAERRSLDLAALEIPNAEELQELFEERKASAEVNFSELPEEEMLPTIWRRLYEQYFPQHEEIPLYEIVWSNRGQRSSLASCNVEKKRVNVATVMQEEDCRPYLEALIYHEMCHAALGEPKVVRGRRIMHGRDFKKLEVRHPGIKLLDEWIKEGGWDKAVRRVRKR